MKIIIDLRHEERGYRGPTDKFVWKISALRGYVTNGFETSGYKFDFESALEEARKAASDIYRFNQKKRKFPYIEKFDPSEVNDA